MIRAALLSFLAFIVAATVAQFVTSVVDPPLLGDVALTIGILGVAGIVYARERPDPRVLEARRGRNVRLEALSTSHYDALHGALMEPAVSAGWRSRGQYVPLYEWERFLVMGLARGWVVFDELDRLVGLVEVRDHDTRDRVAYLSAVATAEFLHSGLLLEAIMLAVDEALPDLDLVKLMFILSESSLAAVGEPRLTELVEVEGRLRGHTHLEGRRQDVIIAALRPSAFRERLQRLPWLASLSPSWRHLPATSATAPAPPPASELEAHAPLALQLDRPVDTLLPTAPLRIDELDSFTALELLVEIEDAQGHPVAPELLASIETVGDYLRWVAR